MLHRQQLELVNLVLKAMRKTQAPFGGLQVVFCGDFFQLPPVGKPSDELRDKFAFMSPSWLEANPVICYLNTQHRQSDNSLNKLLNRMREGACDASDIELLRSVRNKEISDEQITRLYTHNTDVDRLNKACLKDLKGESREYKAEIKGNETLRDILRKSVLTDENLELKTGARVMFIKNNYEKGYMNGSIGVITSFSEDGYPLVKLKNGDLIEASEEDWSIQDDHGKVLASFKQVPLRLAWAITIHKSQGMTLDEALIDLGKSFERGQGYVALSRLRDFENLYLDNFNGMALEVEPLVLKADKRFRELSKKSDSELSLADLEKEADRFIELAGGVPLGSSKKSKKKLKYKGGRLRRVAEESTPDKMTSLLSKGMDIDSICKNLSRTKGTVLGHLMKMKEKGELPEIGHLRPDEEMLGQLNTVIAALNDENEEFRNKRTLTPIHSRLEGKYSFDEIRLALLFTEN
jgi:hypothetical protein